MLSCVKFPEGFSDFFKVERGTRQGDVLSPALFNLFINDVIPELEMSNPSPTDLDGLLISTLLYADDLVLLSLTKEGLQACLDTLSKYCKSWKLQINISKSKILVFEKRRCKFQDKFTVDNQELETVDSYTYLGTNISYTGNFMNGVVTLEKKKKKAMFVLMKTINSNNMNPGIAIRLFKTFISPILTYNCEVWGAQFMRLYSNNNPDQFLKNLDRYHFEQVQNKFCKWIVGVNRYTSNSASRAELGIYPLLLYIIRHSFDYMKNLKKTTNPLLQKALIVDSALNEKTSLSKTIQKVVDYIQEQKGITDIDSATLCKSLKEDFENKFFKSLACDVRPNVNQKNKLRTYRHFKTKYSYEPYLDIIKSRSVRSTYAKFRLSNHQLMIEKGRYLGLPPENRLCPFGCNKVEDEFHFFAKCSFNSDIRSKFTNEIFDANHSCLSLPDFHKCISSADESVVLRSALYVRDSFVTRKNALQKQ